MTSLGTRPALQLSVTVAFPKAAAMSAGVGLHLIDAASETVICGASASFTTTLKVHLALLPLLSVAVQVTVVVPTGNLDPDTGTQVTLAVTPGQELAGTGAAKFTTALH